MTGKRNITSVQWRRTERVCAKPQYFILMASLSFSKLIHFNINLWFTTCSLCGIVISSNLRGHVMPKTNPGARFKPIKLNESTITPCVSDFNRCVAIKIWTYEKKAFCFNSVGLIVKHLFSSILTVAID